MVDVVGLLLALLLVRRRPFQPADRRDRREQPGELGDLRPVALDEQRAVIGIEAERQQRRGHLARPRPQDVARRACWSARGSRRCSRSPRTRTGAGRSCGSRRGRCRDGRSRTAGCPRRSAGRAAVAASGEGAGASSVVMARECSGPTFTRRSLRAVGYHSADVTTRPSPVMSGARLRVGVLGAGTVGREVVGALLDRPDDLRPADGAALELVAVAVRDANRASAAGPAGRARCPTLRPTSSPTSGSTSSSS